MTCALCQQRVARANCETLDVDKREMEEREMERKEERKRREREKVGEARREGPTQR